MEESMIYHKCTHTMIRLRKIHNTCWEKRKPLLKNIQKKNTQALLLDRNMSVSILPKFTPQRDSLQPHKIILNFTLKGHRLSFPEHRLRARHFPSIVLSNLTQTTPVDIWSPFEQKKNLRIKKSKLFAYGQRDGEGDRWGSHARRSEHKGQAPTTTNGY